MLMIILGAGASYDSLPSKPPNQTSDVEEYRPPLADDLFGDRVFFNQAIDSFARCRPIIALLRHRPENESVEQVLQQMQTEAARFRDRHKHLAAVRYYLQKVIWDCQLRWEGHSHGITNYAALLDRISLHRKADDEVYLVTFNYDTMLENDLATNQGVRIRDIPDYIADPRFKVFKVHGSVNWAHEVETRLDKPAQYDTAAVVNLVIENAADLKTSASYHFVDAFPLGKVGETAHFPALAIPIVQGKSFEFPDDHLAALTAALPKVSKILIIGWRGTEDHFLSLMLHGVKDSPKAMIVNGGPAPAGVTQRKLESFGLTYRFQAARGGFTDFIRNREVDEFLTAKA